VITASNALQFSYESIAISRDTAKPSIFTQAIVTGLVTGDADVDGDGLVSVDDLYDYVYREVRAQLPNQTPTRIVSSAEGTFYVARSLKSKPPLLPFYLAMDVSAKTDGDVIRSMTRLVPGIFNSLSQNPQLCDIVRLSIVDFSDDSRVQMSMCDPLDRDVVLPSLKPRQGRRFTPVFEVLRDRITVDVTKLASAGFRSFRPIVLFITIGNPDDSRNQWKAAFSRLTEYDPNTRRGFPWYPIFVPFGVSEGERVVDDLVSPRGHSRAIYGKDGTSISDVIAELIEVITSSTLDGEMHLA
jgi:uncharacterized protein YegL